MIDFANLIRLRCQGISEAQLQACEGTYRSLSVGGHSEEKSHLSTSIPSPLHCDQEPHIHTATVQAFPTAMPSSKTFFP